MNATLKTNTSTQLPKQPATRIVKNAIRAVYGNIPITVELLHVSENNQHITFIADGYHYEFNCSTNPSRMSKKKWYAKELYTLIRRENGPDTSRIPRTGTTRRPVTNPTKR